MRYQFDSCIYIRFNNHEICVSYKVSIYSGCPYEVKNGSMSACDMEINDIK
jgi:hypothetical protein